MKLNFSPYQLQLKHTFTIANCSRDVTPVVLIEIEHQGITGYGEASLPLYLGETQETVANFLTKLDLTKFDTPLLLEDILNYIDNIEQGNTAAKAAVDIALHDLIGKKLNTPWHQIWGLNKEKTPLTTFTIGIDTPEIIRQKVKEAEAYAILKVKLGVGNDKEIIQAIRAETNKPLAVDINQGWRDKEKALAMSIWLKEQGVILIEQPFPKDRLDLSAWLKERSPLPIFADESIQRIEDLLKIKDAFDGVNIKLMKCAGMREAHKIALMAKELGLRIMVGCMTETSCAISAMAQLSPLAEIADLDGNLLIKNDCFEGIKIKSGKIVLNDLPGIGISRET